MSLRSTAVALRRGTLKATPVSDSIPCGNEAAFVANRTVYRIVHAPTIQELDLDDFRSDSARGIAPPTDPVRAQLHHGISTFNTERQARNKALDYPFLGAYIAAIELEDGAPILIERTLRGSPGHQTIWGDPAEVRSRVVLIVSV